MASLENKISSQYPTCNEFDFGLHSFQNRHKNGNLDNIVNQHLKGNAKPILAKKPKQPPVRTAYNKLCKVYVDLFPKTFSKKQLELLFNPFGELEMCHIEPDRTEGVNISFGFVIFKKEESVSCAIEGLKNHVVGGNIIYVGYTPKYRRGKGGRGSRMNLKNNSSTRKLGKLEIRGLPIDYTDKQLKDMVSLYGCTPVAYVQPLDNNNGERVGVVRVRNRDIADAIKSALDGTIPPGFTKPIRVLFTAPKMVTLQMVQQSRRKRANQAVYVPRRHHGMVYGWHFYYCHPSQEHQPTWKDIWTISQPTDEMAGRIGTNNKLKREKKNNY